MKNNYTIKSIPSVSNFIVTTVVMIILLFIAGVGSFEYYDDFQKGEFKWIDILNIIFWSFGIVGFFYISIFGSRNIILKNDRIIFKSIIHRRFDYEFEFNKLDYYFIGYEYGRFDEYKTLYLVKDKKVIERISSFNYRNFETIVNKLKIEKREKIMLNIIQKGLIIFRKKIKVD
ncbi:MAG: hypothetical protein R3342_13060 [Lutibacter sp.]|uniref:hypothetical protein n=1 Tax=Lutibacter sp. TaxID=1925666 RepID=UPI00299E89D9|nr:hypothetical protein [Lutibacter sp.]MDX1830462.1 hypothetical protein [Lutibacter sp.]